MKGLLHVLDTQRAFGVIQEELQEIDQLIDIMTEIMGPWKTPHPDPEPTLEQLQELDDLVDEMPLHQVEELLSSCGSKWTDTLSFWSATRSRMDDLLDSIHEMLSQETT